MGARPGSRVGTAKEIIVSRTKFSGTGDDTANRVLKAGRRLSDDTVKLYSASRFGEVRLRVTRRNVRVSRRRDDMPNGERDEYDKCDEHGECADRHAD